MKAHGAGHRLPGGSDIPLNADGVSVPGNETAIAAGRINQAVARVSYRPSQERRDDSVGRVVGAGLFLRESLGSSPTAVRESFLPRVQFDMDGPIKAAATRIG